VVCDIDSGIDPLHPLLFRADGGYFPWIDVDRDGVFTPGVDGVDRDGDGTPEILRVQSSLITEYYNDNPKFGSDDPSFALGMDWLYADLNNSGARELGPEAGFTEADPSYGEPLFVADDADGDGALEPDERLIALGTSKIRAVWRDGDVYRRGENLILAPRDEEVAHGTGAAGVMAGGIPGLTRLVGMAPDVEVVSAALTEIGQETELTDFCIEEGARVVLHEYAPWVGFHLDGSSELELLISETAQEGIVHVNPAGNLSGSRKLYKKSFAAGSSPEIPVEVPIDSPYGDFRFLGMSWLWRDPARALAMTLEDPTGFSMEITTGGSFLYTDWHDGLKVYAERIDSSRGTARVDVYIFGESGAPPPIPQGTWTMRVTDPAAPGGSDLELFGYALDDLSGWGEGIHFPDSSSEDHLIGYPGTADLGIAVAATTGHGFWGAEPGKRAPYSGRGRRIDGEQVLWISAPDDPITSGYRPGDEARYIIYGGTSGASPHVAGAAALLLQADPARTGVDVREAIRGGALADAAVGEAPNDDYGHGKLRVYRSLYGEDPPGGGPPTIAAAPVVATIGEEAAIPVDASDPDEPAAGLVIEADQDYDGVYDRRAEGAVVRAVFYRTGRHVIRLRVRDSDGLTAGALVMVEVEPPPLIAGGGCALGGRRSGAWWALLPATLLFLRHMGRRQRPRSTARLGTRAASRRAVPAG
jgi:subtilisin family serine protease